MKREGNELPGIHLLNCMKSSSMESGAWILVVQRAKNRSFFPRFASPVRSSVWDIDSFHTVSLRSA
jgi:hypothetical protein